MKKIALFTLLLVFFATPALTFAQNENHVTVGAFADYLRFDQGNTINFAGVGGRVGFYLNPWSSIEGEMAYDFARNNTQTFDNGLTTSFATTRLRPLTGLFGPKFQTNRGGADFFVTGKVGFVNFGTSFNATAGGLGGFPANVSAVDNGNTHFAVYPGVGVEGFWGPFGLRAEVGDTVYFSGGAQNNLRVTFGPQFRF